MSKEVIKFIKKYRVALAGAALAGATLLNNYYQGTDVKPESSNVIQPGWSLGWRFNQGHLEITASEIPEGQKPILCGDGRALRNTVYPVRFHTIKVGLDELPTPLYVESSILLPPAKACR